MKSFRLAVVLWVISILMIGCGTIEVRTTGWKAVEGKGITKDALAALTKENAPQKAFRIGGMVLIETSCEVKYNTFFTSMKAVEGKVCGASYQADDVSSSVDPNALMMMYLMDKYQMEPVE